MTINSFHDSQLNFTPRLTITPAYVETNQCTCRDVISRALRCAPAAIQKGVADLYQLQLMHVHTGIKDFIAAYSYKYVASYS